MRVFRIRDLLVLVAVVALGMAVGRDPIARPAMLSVAMMAGAVLACRYGLQASHAAWEDVERAGAVDELGSLFKVSGLLVLSWVLVAVLIFGAVLFGGLAVLGLFPALNFA